MRRGVAAAAGSLVTGFGRLPCPRKPILLTPRVDRLRARVVGRRVAEVGRIGKRVALRIDSGDRLVIEPRMTGLVGSGEPPSATYLRVELALDGPLARVWFWDLRGLGKVRLYTAEEFDDELGPSRIGPDGLAVTGADLRSRLGTSRRAVKVALLDQRAVAGIGNIYAAEILHAAGLDPGARCARLTARAWGRLAEATRLVLDEAIRHEGSSLGDGAYRNRLNELGSYQLRHRVYGREGLPCGRCGVAIARIVQAQRSTYFCPGCQRGR